LKTPDAAFEAMPIRERAKLPTEFVPENYPFIAQYLLHWCKDPFPGLELVRICILSVGEVGMTSDFERFQLDFSDIR
jgi:hypothetical protein